MIQRKSVLVPSRPRRLLQNGRRRSIMKIGLDLGGLATDPSVTGQSWDMSRSHARHASGGSICPIATIGHEQYLGIGHANANEADRIRAVDVSNATSVQIDCGTNGHLRSGFSGRTRTYFLSESVENDEQKRRNPFTIARTSCIGSSSTQCTGVRKLKWHGNRDASPHANPHNSWR